MNQIFNQLPFFKFKINSYIKWPFHNTWHNNLNKGDGFIYLWKKGFICYLMLFQNHVHVPFFSSTYHTYSSETRNFHNTSEFRRPWWQSCLQGDQPHPWSVWSGALYDRLCSSGGQSRSVVWHLDPIQTMAHPESQSSIKKSESQYHQCLPSEL